MIMMGLNEVRKESQPHYVFKKLQFKILSKKETFQIRLLKIFDLEQLFQLLLRTCTSAENASYSEIPRTQIVYDMYIGSKGKAHCACALTLHA